MTLAGAKGRPRNARRRSVVDASALLAYLQKESGTKSVENALETAAISTVNLAEVLQKCLARGLSVSGVRADLEAAGIEIVEFTPEDAEEVASLWPLTRSAGLSLGDRACLALARRLSVPVYTADRVWGSLALGVKVRTVR